MQETSTARKRQVSESEISSGETLQSFPGNSFIQVLGKFFIRFGYQINTPSNRSRTDFIAAKWRSNKKGRTIRAATIRLHLSNPNNFYSARIAFNSSK